MASAKWTEDSLADLDEIDFAIARRIVEKVSWLEEHFSSVVPEKLHHSFKGLYKLRVGDYRVIYSLADNVILIEAVRHRREVYR
jgi:mRNA interferase RelE/StbE